MVAPALAVAIVAATAAGLLVARTDAPGRPRAGAAHHPATWLLVVTALLFLNQVLFTVYVAREWHGDVSHVARYLPDGWFALADLDGLADRVPAPHLLGATVLRAQAGLELPFVLLAYLTVCRWFGAGVFRRAVAARWAASAAWTVTFCLIEWRFLNPYTVDDLVVRGVAGLIVPALLGRLAGDSSAPPRMTAWVASAGALGCLVLVVYDVALLYNLGHLASRLPVAVVAALVLGGARWWARVPVDPGPTATATCRCLGWFLVFFLVPALPLRYGLSFGAARTSVGAGAVIVAAAVWRGGERRLAGRLALVGGTGALAGVVGLAAVPGLLVEARLLVAAGAAALVGGGTALVLDRVRPPAGDPGPRRRSSQIGLRATPTGGGRPAPPQPQLTHRPPDLPVEDGVARQPPPVANGNQG